MGAVKHTMTYLAFDPGLSTGWARFADDGELERKGTCVGIEELLTFLEAEPKPTAIICEEFKLFKQRAIQQSGSDMIAPQVIGMIKVFQKRWGCPMIMQPANIKPIAQLWSGLVPVGAHKNSHWIDAVNHGWYYLQKNGILKSRIITEGK